MSDIKKWDVEDEAFWESTGKKIARRNLWISIPSLLCGFAVWLYWGVITVQMLNLGFPFAKPELFTLMAIAGLTGATLRIPSSFFIRICGGRNTIFFTTALLMIPAIGTGIALTDRSTPLWVFQFMALLSGFGGGNFASSMSNISFFFPRKMQGLALGLNAGLGNFGVTTMQILVPLAVVGWFGLNNIRTPDVSPDIPNPIVSFATISGMLFIGLLTSAVGLWLMLPESANGSGWNISKEIVMVLVVGSTVMWLKLVPGTVGTSLTRQYKIFNNHHTWVMSVIYTMTFGSFIGFSAAFPLSIKVIFGYQHLMVDGVLTHNTNNPNGPSALMFAWMGPFIGALIRPVGGWIADKVGGALVTQACSVVMTLCAIGVAHYMKLAYHSATPEEFFVPFFLLFLLLFAATGIGNGSTFRSIAIIFNREQAGPVLGWTSAVAAYGAFYIPKVIGEQIEATTPEVALYGFAAFYAVCIGVNWWFYLRKAKPTEVNCPKCGEQFQLEDERVFYNP